MQSTVGIFSILLLALTLSNFWQTEAIVVPVDKLEQDLFSEDVVGDADSKSESVGLQDVEHNGDSDDLRMEESEVVLIPARLLRLISRLRSDLHRLRNIYRRVPEAIPFVISF
ncbi:unnamed protein product [Hymenolepis diminuta]|uniref:Uncharacterized protein n=1 Tax=Hymenolepis diminuta TaxID=6216 RepID=A0A564Z1W6_HYMDI|nr:unnamed protein product [Hymenolepis diminuta]